MMKAFHAILFTNALAFVIELDPVWPDIFLY